MHAWPVDHVSRTPTTAQEAHFHRWMPMAMVAKSYPSAGRLIWVHLSASASTWSRLISYTSMSSAASAPAAAAPSGLTLVWAAVGFAAAAAAARAAMLPLTCTRGCEGEGRARAGRRSPTYSNSADAATPPAREGHCAAALLTQKASAEVARVCVSVHRPAWPPPLSPLARARARRPPRVLAAQSRHLV